MTRAKSIVYMGIDPGTSNTGIAIIKKTGSKTKIMHLETIRTTTKNTKEERFDIILDRIERCAADYNVRKVICEAFEVRTWQKPMKKCVIMSKLVNAVSQRIYSLDIPFMLSSPDVKRMYSVDDIEKDLGIKIADYKIPYFTHAQDALRHVLYQSKDVY